MNEHVGLLQIHKQISTKHLLMNPKQQFVLSVICGESVKGSTWEAHYTAKIVHFQ